MDTLEREQTLASKEDIVKGVVQVVVAEVIGTSLKAHTSTASVRMTAYEDKGTEATDMQWTTSGTPVIEEPWPGLLPEYVPDYTKLV